MPRADTTQDTVLGLIVKHLRDQLGLNSRQCYESLGQEAPTIPVGGDYIVVVEPGAGVFIEGEQAPENITEEWSVLVTAYSRIAVDDTGHDEKMLRGNKRSLLELKRMLLKAISGKDLKTGDGDTFLRWLLRVQHAERPVYSKERHIGWITLTVGVDYDWDITE